MGAGHDAPRHDGDSDSDNVSMSHLHRTSQQCPSALNSGVNQVQEEELFPLSPPVPKSPRPQPLPEGLKHGSPPGLVPGTAGGLPERRPPSAPPAHGPRSCHMYEAGPGRRTFGTGSASGGRPSGQSLGRPRWGYPGPPLQRPWLCSVSFLLLQLRGQWPPFVFSLFLWDTDCSTSDRQTNAPAHRLPVFSPCSRAAVGHGGSCGSTSVTGTAGRPLGSPQPPLPCSFPSRGPAALVEVPGGGGRSGALWPEHPERWSYREPPPLRLGEHEAGWGPGGAGTPLAWADPRPAAL